MLTREQICTEALGLIDEVGVDRLSMRSLADRLGVTATAIYYHFEGRDELVDSVVELICNRIITTPTDGAHWHDRIVSMLLELTDQAHAYPKATAWVITTYARRGPMLRLHEEMLRCMREGGIEFERAITIKFSCLRLCVGHLTLGAAEEFDLSEIDPDRFPMTVAAQPIIEETDPRAQLVTSLRATISALSAG
jgi:AcrR family transcriptional regulator